jgi:hypothetical protein
LQDAELAVVLARLLTKLVVCKVESDVLP